MRKSKVIATLVAGGLSLATTQLLGQAQPGQGAPQPSRPGQDYNAGATTAPDAPQPAVPSTDNKQTEKSGNLSTQRSFKASHIMGLEVRSDTGDHLGRVQDLIVDVDSGMAPFVIVKEGGALGIGGLHIAVPLRDLKVSDDTKVLTLAATKEQFTSASTSPTGAWAGIASEEWARNVDRYYGQPAPFGTSRFERQELQGSTSATTPGQEYVRTPKANEGINTKADDAVNQAQTADQSRIGTADQALKNLSNKPDHEIKSQVNKILEQKLGTTDKHDVKVQVENGVVTLKGTVANAQSKRDLEEQIKALPGVSQVDDQITATNQ